MKKYLLKLTILISALLFLSGKVQALTYDWTGATSTVWTTASNWKVGNTTQSGTNYPGGAGRTTDVVRIGVVTTISPFTTYPVLSSNITIASLTFGNNNSPVASFGGEMQLTVNATLNITAGLLQQHSPTGGATNSGGTGSSPDDSDFEYFTFDEITTLLGTGTINCATFTVGDNTTGSNNNTVNATLMDIGNDYTSSTLTINVSGDCVLNSASKNNGTNVTRSSRSLISLQAGTLNITGTLRLTNNNPFASVLRQYESLCLFSMDLYANANCPVLNLKGSAPVVVGTAANSANPVDFFNVNVAGGTGTATVIYSGTTQRIYSYNSALTPDGSLDIDPAVYQNLTFSGSGTKTIDAGTLTVAGNFTLAAGTETVDLSANNPTVIIGGNYSSATGTIFKNGSKALTITGTTTNAGTFNHPGAALVTMTGAITNSGTINQTSTGNFQFTGAYNNSTSTSTLAQTGSGTLTFSAGLTNSGTLSQAASGTIGAVNITGTLTNSGTITQTTGAYTVNNAVVNSGNLNLGSANFSISGDYTNSGNFTAGAGTVNFTGSSTQQLAGGAGIGTKFNNVTFSGGSNKILQSGNFSVASTSVMKLTGTNTKVTAGGGNLTLKSDASGTATISALTNGCQVNGSNISVQRYITGGAGFRGYRLLSSPVNNGTTDASGNTQYSLNYLTATVPLTGTGGTAGLFDKAGNPTLYLWRENLVPSSASFTSGNFRGIANLSAAPLYTIDNDGSGFSIPVGNGYLFFFRGGKTTTVGDPFTTTTTPGAATLSATGALNQGAISIRDWYTPGSASLGYTTTSGDISIEGFNLVGNPYPSSIDWTTYSTTDANAGVYAPGGKVGPFAYILHTTGQGNGNYGTYDAVHHVSQNGGTNIIPSGMGFFVIASDNASSFLTFNEAAKTNTQATPLNLYMGKPVETATAQYIKLKMSLDSVNSDETVVLFDTKAKPAYDYKEDAHYKTGNGKVSLSSLSSDNVALAINVLPINAKGLTIPIKLSASVDGTYSLNMNEVVGVPQLFDIWLMDKYKKDSVDMRRALTYSFTITKSDTASFGANRFSLVMRENPNMLVQLINFTVDKLDKKRQVNIAWKATNEQNYTHYTVERSNDNGKTFDVIGGLLSNGQGIYSMLDRSPANGDNLYRLKQEDYNNSITYSNPVLVQYSDKSNNLTGSGHLMVYPNPAINKITLAIDPKSQTSKYSIRITNSVGIIVKQTTTTELTWEDNISNLLTGTYLIQVVDKNNNSFIGQTKFVKL